MSEELQSGKDLRKQLGAIMESVVPSAARLTLHLTGAHPLPKGEVDRLTRILVLFLEAVDALP